MNMSKVVFDIETIGIDFDALDIDSQEYLLKYADDDEKKEEVKSSLGLWAPTARVVAIGMLNPDTDKGVVYYQNGGKPAGDHEEDGVLFRSGSEEDIMNYFWDSIRAYRQFITFNGRTFDCPLLMLRSAMLGIRPSRDLMPYRYDTKIHVDLLDQLVFYGASNRRFSLDFYCKAFGIPSPKGEMDGSKVGEFYKAGKYLDIAKYCYRDICATAKLYEKWDKFLNIK